MKSKQPQKEYLSTDRMRDIIADNSMLLSTLSRFGISLGFGDLKISEVCEQNNVDTPTFLTVANFVSHKHVSETPAVDLRCLIDYLKQAHIYFLDFVLPSIRRRMLEALSASDCGDLSLIILKFFDDYSEEVRSHMEYEDRDVFTYVEKLLSGESTHNYTISSFVAGHKPIASKLHDLKEVIIRHLNGKNINVNLLNSVLFDIIVCEEDLLTHCGVENRVFVPAVEKLEESVNTLRLQDTEEVESSYSPIADLTEREREIICCVAKGYSNKEIANQLFLSVHTVATHRRNIASKLDIHSPSGLTIFAIVNNLIDLKDVKLQS
ncbi:MAG: helix-turn-helix transcriptional regulator [Bacteroidales bacterium]|nr:helix-turn-helix transcriptional regulator [Bacteroidales bacterium]MDE6801797.1 LuxR C-terminal-related transcriptional regulator [Muribaculaceae bacterium]